MDMAENKKTKKIIIGIIIAFVVIALTTCFIVAYKNVKTSDSNGNKNSGSTSLSLSGSKDEEGLNITSGGSYDLSGKSGSITINTKDEVTLNLNGVEITSSNGPAINIEEAEKVQIVLSDTNKITSVTTEDLDGAIYSKADLIISGTGSLEVSSNYDGIVSKDTLEIKEGTYIINSDDDGIRGKDSVEVRRWNIYNKCRRRWNKIYQ